MNQVNNRQRIESKIQFLETQLTSFDYYLPETYDYFVRNLDIQKRLLAEIEVQEIFNTIDSTIDQ
jgi:hypothetical protein